MTLVDWIALAFIALIAIGGARKGLLVGGLSLVGVVVGLFVGGRLAPVLFSNSRSPYTPLVALAAALLLAIAFETMGALAGSVLKDWLRPAPLRMIDAAGGFLLGGATALAVLWIAAVIALHLPQSETLRTQARHSTVLSGLVDALPPEHVLSALSSIDPFPLIVGPQAPSEPPDPRLLNLPGVRSAEPSVVRVTSEACGIGYAGSGWVAAPELVVTAAHVVAGGRHITVEAPGQAPLEARVVAFDGRNDLALLAARSLDEPPLRLAVPRAGDSAVVLGYPGDGPFDAEPARVGSSATLFAPDYARQIVRRRITSLRAKVRRGNSGGPVVNRGGAVELTVFGARKGSDVGYGVSSELVRSLMARIDWRGVSSGSCLE
jgi:S1-C subfamily serine protease